MGRGAAEDKKEELLGAVAIKPAGWDRTGWEAFRYFLYDPDNGTILSRTPKSWLLITVFYTIYYTCLAAFWYVCLIIFFTTIPDKLEGPKWQQKESLIGKNPGIGIRPLNQDERIDSNMFKLKWGDVNTVVSQADGEGDLNADFARRAQKFMEVYDNDAVDYETFSLDNLGPCANHPYGYLANNGPVKPCIFLKFNKIWGWEPTPIDDQDFTENPEWPESFKNHFESLSPAEQQNVFVDCQGRYPADKDALKDLKYYPENQAFPTKYFPYEGESKSIKTSKSVYHSPLVAIQVNLDESYVGQLVHIECRAYYKGVVHETKSKKGLVQFEILLEK